MDGATARITSIQKHAPGRRWRIELDGERAMTLETSTMRALGICEGMEVDPGDLLERSLEPEKAAARERALTMLEHRDHSRREIENDLKRRGYREEAVAHALEALEEYRYLDDGRLAQGMLEAGRGRISERELRRRMRARGIEAEAIDGAFSGLSEEDEEEAALAEARRRLRGKEATPEILAKATDALARKGFSYDTARRAVRRARHNQGDDWEP